MAKNLLSTTGFMSRGKHWVVCEYSSFHFRKGGTSNDFWSVLGWCASPSVDGPGWGSGEGKKEKLSSIIYNLHIVTL